MKSLWQALQILSVGTMLYTHKKFVGDKQSLQAVAYSILRAGLLNDGLFLYISLIKRVVFISTAAKQNKITFNF